MQQSGNARVENSKPRELKVYLRVWSDIANYVKGGEYSVYYRKPQWLVKEYNHKCAIVEASTGDILEMDINNCGYRPSEFYIVVNRPQAEGVTPQNTFNLQRLSTHSTHQGDSNQRVYDAEQKRYEAYFEAGKGHRCPKKGKSTPGVQYIKRRGTFTVDEFAAIHERFKAYAKQRHLEFLKRSGYPVPQA